MEKVWKKAAHKRKYWKNISWTGRQIYYMRPIMEHMFNIWMQPLPFPTMFKCFYTCVLMFLLLLPIIYLLLIFAFYYGIFQFVAERHAHVQFSPSWDLLGFTTNMTSYEISNEKYKLFVNMYIEQHWIMARAICLSVDYMRMGLYLLLN